MKTKDLVKVSLFAVLSLIAGYIKIPLGPVPVTMQTLVVNIGAIILSPLAIFISMALHILLKLILAGPAYVMMPSFGFMIGFAFGGLLGSYYYRNSNKDKKSLLIAIIIAALVPYLLGLPYMAFILNGVKNMNMAGWTIIKTGFLIFIPGDILKIALAYLIAPRLTKALN